MDAESPFLDRIPADFVQDPYPLLARYRAEGPAREVVFAHGARVWLVTRYAEVRALASDPAVSKDGRRANELFALHSGLPVEEAEQEIGFNAELTAHMLNSDPPRHTRLRALVSQAFTARRIEGLRPRVEQLAGQLLDRLGDEPVVDLVSAFAEPLPISTICDLFGIPEQRRADFRAWGTKLVGAGQDPGEVAEAGRMVVEYATSLIEDRRASPGEDMVSALVQASDAGDRLTQGEVVAMIFLLVVAGYVTTIYSIGNAVYNLLTHPAELARLRADASLMPAAIDELTRYDSAAVVGTFRFAAADIPVGEVVIPAGSLIALSWSAANRDSARFPDADRLDLSRRPAGSMSFGHGIHRCIGIPLAKMQIEIALSGLITRYPDLRLAVPADQVRWESSALLRGLRALPVSVFPDR